MREKSAHVYRAERANTEMHSGDDEPPDLNSTAVMRTAKYEYRRRQYLHKDLDKAIQILKYMPAGANIIHDIGSHFSFIIGLAIK